MEWHLWGRMNGVALVARMEGTMGHDQDIGPEGEVFVLKIYIDFMKL